jgi:hypothetical protein
MTKDTKFQKLQGRKRSKLKFKNYRLTKRLLQFPFVNKKSFQIGNI